VPKWKFRIWKFKYRALIAAFGPDHNLYLEYGPYLSALIAAFGPDHNLIWNSKEIHGPCMISRPLFILSLFFWFEPAISQTGTSIHESASLFGMASIYNLHFSINAKNASHLDSIKIAKEVSTFINRRSSKIVILNETLSLNALELHFLVRMSISGSSAKKTLTRYLILALGKNTQVHLTCDVKTCQSEQTNRLEFSECTRIEWKFCSSSSPVVTVLSSEAKSNVTEQQNPNGDNQAAAEAGDGAVAEVSLGLRASELETLSITAAGIHPRPLMVAKTFSGLANLRICRKSDYQHCSRTQKCDASRPVSSGGLQFFFRRAST
jgi:hypothetical protein